MSSNSQTYDQKKIDIKEVAALSQSGDFIITGHSGGFPSAIMHEVVERKDPSIWNTS